MAATEHHRLRDVAYQPALDGVRAVAVVLVLLYHAGFGWMSGGYVGVSVFFTLSGFLITSLALAEHGRSGRLDVGAFYGRRLRRIVPASLVCLAGVMVAARLRQFDGITELRRDLWAALAQVYNWTLLAHGDSYASEIAKAAGQRAPLDHYWSLAIEEQFYWAWPLALLVLLRAGRRSRLVLVGVLWAAFVLAAVIIAASAGGAATYLATPARLPEILLGAVLAVAVHSGLPVPSGGRWAAGACAVVLVCAVTWPASGGPAEAGWLPLFAVASALLIAGLQRRSAVQLALSVAPLVWLGRISYGVYLFHWPVYTLVDERRFPVDRAPLFLLRLAITLAIAAASYYLIELPVRARRVQWRRVAAVAASGVRRRGRRRRHRPRPPRHLHLRRRGNPSGGGDRSVPHPRRPPSNRRRRAPVPAEIRARSPHPDGRDDVSTCSMATSAVGSIAPMLDARSHRDARITAGVLRALPLSFTDGIAVADLASVVRRATAPAEAHRWRATSHSTAPSRSPTSSWSPEILGAAEGAIAAA